MDADIDRHEKLGDCTKEEAFEILDKFYEMGGNFIDTWVFMVVVFLVYEDMLTG